MTDTDKDTLHSELDALLPVSEDDKKSKRSGIRAIGHALIELGLVHAIECGYADCIMDDRKFERDPSKKGGGRKWITLDHVIERCDGGNDMPSNFQLLHLGCNSSKGAKAYFANPERKKEHAILNGTRYKDPEYRKKLSASLKAASSAPETKAKRSQKSKEMWADPEHRDRHSKMMKERWADPDERTRRIESQKKSWDRLTPEQRKQRHAGTLTTEKDT